LCVDRGFVLKWVIDFLGLVEVGEFEERPPAPEAQFSPFLVFSPNNTSD